MKFIGPGLVLLMAPLIASAQLSAVSVEVRLEQQHFLSNEDMEAAVRITNLSGQSLFLGETDDWLAFSIEARDSFVVRKLGSAPVRGAFLLESGNVATKRVNVTPYFDFHPPGVYHVTANVKIPQWNVEISSNPVRFEVISGTTLRSFEFGVPPASEAPPGPPEIRRYVLQQARYLKELRLYVKVTDALGEQTLRVFPVGPMVSFGRPEAQLDRRNNLHILHQIGARTFRYSVVSPDGDLLVKQAHEIYAASRPTLRAMDEGRIIVAGGARRLMDDDVPERQVEKTSASTEPKDDGP